MNRRRFIKGAAIVFCGCFANPAVAWPTADECGNNSEVKIDALKSNGCLLSSGVSSELLSKIRYSFFGPGQNDNKIIEFFISTSVWISERTSVRPDVNFFDDSQSPNAFATDASLTGGCNSDGTILFGTTLFKNEMNQFKLWQSSTTMILAHEYGHIVQFKKKLRLPTYKQELHADFMGGWLCGLMTNDRRTSGIDPQTASKSIFNKGNYAFNDPGFHGTPEERMKFTLQGYESGLRGLARDEAFVRGLNYLGY